MALPPPNGAGGHQAPQPDSRRNVDALAKVPDSRSVASAHDGAGVERVRRALEDYGSRCHGPVTRFRAVCPVHESHGTLTLAVSQGRSGALVKCHASCETAEVLAAVGLAVSDLFDAPREATPGWRPARTLPPDPFDGLKRVLRRAVSIINLGAAQAAYRAAHPHPMPEIPADERVQLAEWASQQDADRHYWRVMARQAALATDEAYVREAYGQRGKWLRTGKYEDKPSPEQDVVLSLRAEDLAREAAAKETPA